MKLTIPLAISLNELIKLLGITNSIHNMIITGIYALAQLTIPWKEWHINIGYFYF